MKDFKEYLNEQKSDQELKRAAQKIEREMNKGDGPNIGDRARENILEDLSELIAQKLGDDYLPEDFEIEVKITGLKINHVDNI